MTNKKQIFFDHKSDDVKVNHTGTKDIILTPLSGYFEFGSEFHAPYGYPLTKEAVTELKTDFKKEEENLKK